MPLNSTAAKQCQFSDPMALLDAAGLRNVDLPFDTDMGPLALLMLSPSAV